jgi:recombination protein RecA
LQHSVLRIQPKLAKDKVGVVYGPKKTQPGGRALKFYASQRLDIRRIET